MQATPKIYKKRTALKGLANVKKKMTELCVLCETDAFLLTTPLPSIISTPFPKVESWSPSTTTNMHSLVRKLRNVGKVHEAAKYRPSLPTIREEAVFVEDDDTRDALANIGINGLEVDGMSSDDDDDDEELDVDDEDDLEEVGEDSMGNFFRVITGKDMMDMNYAELKKAVELIMGLEKLCDTKMSTIFRS